MNIRDLKYLIAIEHYSHFGKAAEACFVSQPALSMQIKKLEETLGVQLIERNNKTVFLTDVGKLISKEATEVLHHVANIKEIAKQAKDPYCGNLYLGIIPTLAPYLLPKIIPGLSQDFPNLKIYLVEEKTNELILMLKRGQLDAALMGLPQQDNDFATLPLFEEEFLLALPNSHPLSSQKRVCMEDLRDKTLILLEDGHCMRDLALAVCLQAKAVENKYFHATSLETLRHMVAANAGITLLPKLAQRSDDGLYYLPFINPRPSRLIGLTMRKTGVQKIMFENITKKIKFYLTQEKTVKIRN